MYNYSDAFNLLNHLDDEKSPQRRKRRCTATSEKHGTSATRKKRHASATPEKRGRNTTPKQKVIASGSNSGKYGQIKNPTESEHTSQLTPNLHLEAKLKAEVCQLLLFFPFL